MIFNKGVVEMFKEIKDKYVNVHKQGWIPIFVNDKLDALQLAKICVDSGLKAIEVTCRRPAVLAEIRQIRKAYPDLIILVGSVVDDDNIMQGFLRKRRADFPTMEQLKELGVDGFVAQLPFSERSLEKYADDFIMIPGVETVSEAVDVLNAGAHFAKFCSSTPLRIKQINSDATHRLFPIFYTGGAALNTLEDYVQSGTALIGGGWDLMLKDKYVEMQSNFNSEIITEKLMAYKEQIDQARSTHVPNFDQLYTADTNTYLKALTHFHPFNI
jgi:2-dehydro-3-deoxyphosphogluconate aldolase/(4S)-4-hydroxy-2-oxoglutarate aldolase